MLPQLKQRGLSVPLSAPREFPPDVLAGVGPAFDDALRAMTDTAFLRTQVYQEQQWRADRKGLHPWLLEFEPLLVRRMGDLGVPLWCHCAVRSKEQQLKGFAEGNSKLRDGPHMYGLAVDIVHGVRAWNLTKKQWALVGHVGKELAKSKGLDLVWGGDWKSPWDPAHWEVKGWRFVHHGFPFPVLAK